MHRITDPLLGATVRAEMLRTDLSSRAVNAAIRRSAPVRADGERGAQAAEYAMLGGVSAAACGTFALLLKREGTLEPVVSTIVGLLTRTVRSWF